MTSTEILTNIELGNRKQKEFMFISSILTPQDDLQLPSRLMGGCCQSRANS